MLNFIKKARVSISGNQLVVLALAALIVVAGSAFYNPLASKAVTTTKLKGTVTTDRVRVTFNDIKAGTNVGDSSRKKISLYTLAGGDQILSIVAKTTAAFVVPGVEGTATDSIVAEISGNQVSNGNVIMPPSLSEPNFENGKGNNTEFMFYDETNPTNIAMTVRSGDGVSSLDNLTSGQIDFYFTVIK